MVTIARSFLDRLLPLMSSQRPTPTRVGVLNSGELVLVDHNGNSQVISTHTTQRIREVLTQPPLLRMPADGS